MLELETITYVIFNDMKQIKFVDAEFNLFAYLKPVILQYFPKAMIITVLKTCNKSQ